MNNYQDELDILESMDPADRRLSLHQLWVNEEESYLRWMINSNKRDDEMVADLTRRAKQLVTDYHTYGDEASLQKAEVYTELAASFKQNRFTIQNIRQQRERVQWVRNRLKVMQRRDEQS